MRPYQAPDDLPDVDDDSESPAIAADFLENQQRQDVADLLDVARCPVCRAPLIARMSCHGPGFFCLCAESGMAT